MLVQCGAKGVGFLVIMDMLAQQGIKGTKRVGCLFNIE
jgi:hypothetical protein